MSLRQATYRRYAAQGLVLIFILLGLTGCGHRSSAEPGRLGVVADPAEITIRREADDHSDAPREVVFRLKNQTTTSIQILDMTASCSCTMAKQPETKLLEPGQDVEIVVSVQLLMSRRQASTLTIQTDSPKTPVVILGVIAIGAPVNAPFISEQPKEIRVIVSGDEAAMAELSIDSVESAAEGAWLSNFTSTDSHLLVEQLGNEVIRPIDDGNLVRRYHIRISAPHLEAGGVPITGWLKFDQSKPAERPSGNVALFFQRTAIVSAVPSSVVFTISNGDMEPQVQRLVLISNEEEQWNCEPVNVPASITVTPDQENGTLPPFAKRFLITTVPANVLSTETGILRFSTTLSLARLIEVPFEFRDPTLRDK